MERRAAKLLFLTLAAYCLPLWGKAHSENLSHPKITITKELDQKANASLEYFLDETNTIHFEEIRNKRDWDIPNSDNLIFGLKPTTVWIKLHLQNNEKFNQSVSLEFNPIFLEKITAYDSSGTIVDSTGSTVSTKRVEFFPTIKFEASPGECTKYISIQSRSNSLSVRVRSETKHQEKSLIDLAIFCLLFGGLLSLMTYHIFLFITYRDWTYLFYSLFIAGMILFTVSFSSIHKLLLPATIFGFHIDFWWSALSAPILLLFMYLFSSKLLSLFPTRPFFTKQNRYRLALLLLPITEIICILSVFMTDNASVLILIRFSALLHLLILPSMGVVIWNRDRSNTISLYYALSWLPFAIGTFLIVAWLSGAVGHHILFSWSPPIGALFQSILLSFAAGQQLNAVTKEKIREQKDKLRLMEELEIEVKKLSRRDQVITTFVSPEIVSELDNGEDPLSYQPRNVNKCIGFIDMHNYTTFFETYSPFDCQKIINEYFSLINDSTYAGGGTVDKIIGDAMMLVFSDPSACLKSIVQLRKNLSTENGKRYAQNQKLLKFGLGVSYGTMLSANFGSSHKFNRTLVGDPVNVASRLENITRLFSVDVLCSKEFIDLQHAYEFYRPAGYVLLKGRKKKSLVYEVFEHQPPEVVKWKLSTKPAIHEAIELELNGKYVEAMRVIQSLIDICPPHTHNPTIIMDFSLIAMIDAIKEKMRQLELKVPTTEKFYTTGEFKRAA